MTRPWELQEPRRTWELGALVYPRTVSIYRLAGPAAGPAGFGAQPYEDPAEINNASVFGSTPAFVGIPCSIQETSQGRTTATDLPGDVKSTVLWRIYIPFIALAKGSVFSRDYIVDDLGVRYQVTDPYWDSLGYRLFVQILET